MAEIPRSHPKREYEKKPCVVQIDARTTYAATRRINRGLYQNRG